MRNLLELSPKEQPEQPKAANDNAKGAKPNRKRKVSFVRASDVEPQNVDWLWKYYLARGSLTLLFGEKGLCKSQVADSLIASVTKTGRWPDGTPAPLGSAIILGSENHKAMTSRPRLDAAGADASRVFLLDSVENENGDAATFSLQQDLAQLKAAMEEMGDVVLIVIDPITSYMGAQLDSHKVTEVRAVLEPLGRFAEDHNVVIVMVTHPTKAVQDKSINMAVGSGAFVHLPRTGFVVMPDPEESEPRADGARRFMLCSWTNIGRMPPGLAYRSETAFIGKDNSIETQRVVWDSEPINLTADQALAKHNHGSEDRASARRDAIDFLRKKLADGPKPAKDLTEEADALGISARTLARARKDLEIGAQKDGFDGGWLWELPFWQRDPKGANGASRSPEGCH